MPQKSAHNFIYNLDSISETHCTPTLRDHPQSALGGTGVSPVPNEANVPPLRKNIPISRHDRLSIPTRPKLHLTSNLTMSAAPLNSRAKLDNAPLATTSHVPTTSLTPDITAQSPTSPNS